ncbi:DHH family phosphoesterase [Halegenticoccus tardaugens]|uniref:DHH family phosphoesterase n=1 Tax=Halegenticoccus tardaugens TaxID=2071624 RepID=UPI00100AFBD2|nr:DHH family phosphoesterase [Halegenticoccus tardaugens]
MVYRLVLGCGPVGRDIVERTADRPGDVRVLTRERSWVTALREEGINATEGDTTDPANYPESADVIVAASKRPERNLAAAETARERFPDALLVAYTGVGADEGTKAALAEVADRVIDPEAALVDALVDATAGTSAVRLRRLFGVLRDLDGRLAVVTHDNPDPDAIGSALALARLAGTVGVDADVCYFGEISHQQNRALVNLLDLDLRRLDPEDSLEEYDGIALVDHSRPGVNDGLDDDTFVDVVVDHHPPRAPVEARFVDLRSDAGSTSTLLTDYYERLGLVPDGTVATALLYGIRVDTNDFSREVSATDFEAAAFLLPYVDASVLDRVETPSMSAEVLETMARSIRNREMQGSALASCVGQIRDRDALAQAADMLLGMEGVQTTLVYGFMDGMVYASARARGSSIDMGEALRDAFDQIGSAGGHADMAGAQIPLGILGDVDEESAESLAEIVRDIITERFFEILRTAPSAPEDDIIEELAFQYPVDGK